MIDYKIMINGEPIAKKRPLFVHKDRNGKALPYVKVVNKQEDEEAKFKWAVISYLTENEGSLYMIDDTPISITCSFYMERPKSHYGTGKNSGILKQNSPRICIKKKDLDNMEKFVFDCLNGLAWKDDKQVAESHARKLYSEKPRTEIIIRSI